MNKKELLEFLEKKIIEKKENKPLLVWINWVDASWKTLLSKELYNYLKNLNYDVINASIDWFHNSKDIRYKRWKNSPEWFYYDSYNYNKVSELLLDPINQDNLQYKTSYFDYRTESKTNCSWKKATKDSILLMEGIFIFRPEFIKYWDLKIFIDVPFDITLERALKRIDEINHIGSKQKIIDSYKNRYIPWQQLYFNEAHTKEKADIVIDNTDFTNPIILDL